MIRLIAMERVEQWPAQVMISTCAQFTTHMLMVTHQLPPFKDATLGILYKTTFADEVVIWHMPNLISSLLASSLANFASHQWWYPKCDCV